MTVGLEVKLSADGEFLTVKELLRPGGAELLGSVGVSERVMVADVIPGLHPDLVATFDAEHVTSDVAHGDVVFADQAEATSRSACAVGGRQPAPHGDEDGRDVVGLVTQPGADVTVAGEGDVEDEVDVATGRQVVGR